jgi:hypothetical protein
MLVASTSVFGFNCISPANAAMTASRTCKDRPPKGSISADRGRSQPSWVCGSGLRDGAALLIATSASNSLQRRLSPPSWLPRLDHLVGPANSALRTNLKSNLG